MNDITVKIPKKAFLPCYFHLLKSEADINFLWGGRDSGKTHFIAQKMVVKCLSASRFRCVLIRKTFNSIHDSQFQAIKDVVDQWGLNDLFTFREAPLSIRCINGNGFICRGCDAPGNLKSIKDPTDAWYEEGNQLTLSDFITVATTLRSNHGDVQQWFSFNPEAIGDFEEFWLYKTFFKSYSGDIYQNFTSDWTIPTPKGDVKFTYTSTHTTYHDNKFVRQARIALLEHLAELNPHYYIVFTIGKWGNEKVDSPFCYAFDKARHAKVTTLNRRHETILSFDFNVNPITCGVYQHYDNAIFGIESIKLDNSDIYKLTDYIDSHYKGCMFLVTGDATGRNTTALVQDGINYYTVIKSKLRLAAGQIKVDTVNPRVKDNRVLVNTVLHDANITFDPQRCKYLLFDLEKVGVNDVGEIDKGNRNDPKKRADHLDHFRYYLNKFHKHLLRS